MGRLSTGQHSRVRRPLVLHDCRGLLDSPGEWSEASLPTSSGPLRCRTRGGRRSDGAAYITLAVADAPHRLILAENSETMGTLTVGWNTSPLHGLDPAALVAT